MLHLSLNLGINGDLRYVAFSLNVFKPVIKHSQTISPRLGVVRTFAAKLETIQVLIFSIKRLNMASWSFRGFDPRISMVLETTSFLDKFLCRWAAYKKTSIV